MVNQYTSGWTREQIDILKSNVGQQTFESIGEKIGKTARAVESKLDKMGLANTKIASGLITVHELARTLKVDDKTVRRWIKNRGLPATQRNLRYRQCKKQQKRLFTYISIEEFWKWAESDKDLINWSNLDPFILTPEPDWVEERRKKDYHKKPKRKIWTPQEDRIIWRLFYEEGKMQKDIAEIMGVTSNSIEKRLKRLRDSGYAKKIYQKPNNQINDIKFKTTLLN